MLVPTAIATKSAMPHAFTHTSETATKPPAVHTPTYTNAWMEIVARGGFPHRRSAQAMITSTNTTLATAISDTAPVLTSQPCTPTGEARPSHLS